MKKILSFIMLPCILASSASVFTFASKSSNSNSKKNPFSAISTQKIINQNLVHFETPSVGRTVENSFEVISEYATKSNYNFYHLTRLKKIILKLLLSSSESELDTLYSCLTYGHNEHNEYFQSLPVDKKLDYIVDLMVKMLEYANSFIGRTFLHQTRLHTHDSLNNLKTILLNLIPLTSLEKDINELHDLVTRGYNTYDEKYYNATNERKRAYIIHVITKMLAYANDFMTLN